MITVQQGCKICGLRGMLEGVDSFVNLILYLSGLVLFS